jgi:4,5-DOPA dioxygenase extradiol
MAQPSTTGQKAQRMPVLFVGHGSPMNAIEENPWSSGFQRLADLVPRPRAILAVSAHWYTVGTFVTDNAQPETIHDFSGFPRELSDVRYPARGDVDLAKRVVTLLGREAASPRSDWGLDHGTWSVARRMYPAADIPIVQLSIDHRSDPSVHLSLGHRLGALRSEGVLILASGNVVHNLRHALGAYSSGETATPKWATAFDGEIEKALSQHDDTFLTRALDTEHGGMAHPSPDHYLPLLYAAGASDTDDGVSFPISGFDMTSLSMRAVLFG